MDTQTNETASTVIALEIGSTSKRSRFKPLPVSIDWNKLPDASQNFIIRYGLKQWLADAQAGAESEAIAHDAVKERVKKLETGDLTRAKGEGAAKPDTVESRALKLAVAYIREQLKAANAKAEAAVIKEAAAELVKGDESFTKEAKKQLDAEAKMAEGKTDAAKTVIGNLLAKIGGNAPTEPEGEGDEGEGEAA